MRRILPFLAAAALALGTTFATGGPASAFGGEYLACSITPGGYTSGDPSYCEDSTPATSYGFTFTVEGGSGTYGYAWTLPSGAGAYTVYSGCTSSTGYCDLLANGSREHDFIVSVVISQGGQQATLTAEADSPATCHLDGVLVLC